MRTAAAELCVFDGLDDSHKTSESNLAWDRLRQTLQELCLYQVNAVCARSLSEIFVLYTTCQPGQQHVHVG